MLPNIDLNLLAVVVAAVAAMALGALWYSPIMFGNVWVKLSGMTKKDMKKAKDKRMGKLYFANFIGVLIMSYVLAFLIYSAGVTSMADGFKIALLVWVGFVVPLLLGGVLWEGKPMKLYYLNVSYQLISIVLMSIIITAWI